MKREDLKKLGLTEEAIEKAGLEADTLDKIMALHGKDIEAHKGKATAAEESVKTLQEQLTAANKQIEEFKGMNIDQIKAAADDYKTKYEQAQTEHANQILSIKRSNALEKQLKETYKVRDVKSVRAHLDDEKIQFNEKDETFIGLDDLMKPVKEKYDYLFETDEADPKIVIGGKNKTVIGDASVIAAREAAGLPIEKDK